MTILTLETPSLGDRSYLVHDGTVAMVVDPQRDLDRLLAVLDERGLRLTHVFETHLHNDYVTGGLALAARTGAAYLLNGADDVSFERTPLADGDVVEVGDRMRVTALATPGHTFTHLSYALTHAGTGAQVAAFSGGSLLYGATGRPDLLGAEHTHELAHHQHASAHRLADELPDDAALFPTHGFGSFCSASQSTASSSTIGGERSSNPVFTQDAETWTRELLDGLSAYPAYYAHMAPRNAAGPDEADLSPPHLAEPVELRQRIDSGEWVVDLRHRTVFAASHLPGALNFGLDGSFATYLGWLVRWGAPLTLLGESERGRRRPARAGADRDRPARRRVGRRPRAWSDGTAHEPGPSRPPPSATSPRSCTTER